MISLKNITKKYGDLTVYKNFDFDIEEGKITCVLGESGCGKTTLLNVIANLTEYQGEVTPVKCSYVFQTPNLLPNLTVFNNLKLVNPNLEEVENILKECKLLEKMNSYPFELSGGQKQRVSIARAFLYPSKLILMDEPFSSLDLRLKLSIAELFVNMQKSQNRTALFVTHDIDEALMLSDRIVVLKDGAVKKDLILNSTKNLRPFGGNETLRKQIMQTLIN